MATTHDGWRFGSIAEHFQEDSQRGSLPLANCVGRAGSAALWGTITIFARVDGGAVNAASYVAEGCGYTAACGSMLVEWMVGRSARECLLLTPAVFAAGIEGVPPHKRHCPLLAVEAMHDALRHQHTDRGPT